MEGNRERLPLIRFLGILLIGLSSFCFAQKQITTIPLTHNSADTLIPALRAHISPDSSITAYQNTLIINATAQDTQTVKALIKQLEGEGQQLMIFVKSCWIVVSFSLKFPCDTGLDVLELF